MGAVTEQNELNKKVKIDQDLEFISICVKSSQYIIIHNLSKFKNNSLCNKCQL